MVQLPPDMPPPPKARLSLGVTGHRETHAAWETQRVHITRALGEVLDIIEKEINSFRRGGTDAPASTRMHSILADGVDQLVAREALRRGWELVVPMPFGAALNRALNARPATVADAEALLAGGTGADADVQARGASIDALAAQARLLELADQDDVLAPAYLAMMASPGDTALRDAFNADVSMRVALASRIVVEQSDILVAVWDGARTSFPGGTGHTVAVALDNGTPVVWIDALDPASWRILTASESLASPRAVPVDPARAQRLREAVQAGLSPTGPVTRSHGVVQSAQGVAALDPMRWRGSSLPLWHAYRFIESAFGGGGVRTAFRSLRSRFEAPHAIGQGSGAGLLSALRALPGGPPQFAEGVERCVLRRFALADGIASHLSDVYRGGMSINFVLSALAIVGGIAYLPLFDYHWKWPFALFEFVLLTGIVAITLLGQRYDWHGRWFETRRVAEYLRHAPLLLALGAARPPGRWPRGGGMSWPEHYALQAGREIGLPQVRITSAYLRAVLETLVDAHVTRQRDYHRGKAERLARVHANLDRLSEVLFLLAIASVSVYLIVEVTAPEGAIGVKGLSKAATFLGVMLPTFGAAVAGIRYFGDFERFAAISEITATKLASVHDRIQILLAAPDEAIDYGAVADVARDCDEIVISEIENWQSVFGGKHITIPV